MDTVNVCHHITKIDLPPREMKETIFTRQLLKQSDSSSCPDQGVRLAVAHSPVAIGNFGGLFACIPMVTHQVSGNKIDNIMVVIIYNFLFH